MALFRVNQGVNESAAPYVAHYLRNKGVPNQSGLINYFSSEQSDIIYNTSKVEQSDNNSSMNYTSHNIKQSFMPPLAVTSKRLCEQSANNFVIAQDINADGAKQFHGFNTV
jgi:hypothetical protein